MNTHHRPQSSWGLLAHGEFRSGKKYRRQSHHESREVSPEEQQAREWKAEIHKGKDRRYSYMCGPGHFYKRKRTKQHRQWSKRRLHNEDWDAFTNYNDQDYACWVDPYLWS
jgi:ferredoxin-NADP reductase